uniref:Uncharacterized protein n=1 Tax=Stomoxys calcitrans TaxID=35570 RepID=A0A1I8NRK0_STOCA
MLPKAINFLIFLNLLIICQASEKKDFNLVLGQPYYEIVNPQIIQRLEYFYKQLVPGRYSGNCIFILNQQLDKNLDVQLKILLGIRGKSVKFIDLKVNMCDILYRGMSMSIARKIMVNILQKSNFPRKCPFKANFIYNASNFIIDDSYFPKYTPYPMDFNVSIDYFENQELIAMLQVKGSTVPKVKK